MLSILKVNTKVTGQDMKKELIAPYFKLNINSATFVQKNLETHNLKLGFIDFNLLHTKQVHLY